MDVGGTSWRDFVADVLAAGDDHGCGTYVARAIDEAGTARDGKG
jgi:hypothetical protein